MMVLSIQREGGEAREVRLAGESALLGKHAACDVVLDDARVSRRHARLRVAGAELLLEDLGSTNGTEVGGQQIEGEQAIGPEQEIVIGPFHIVARLVEPPAAQPPAAPAVENEGQTMMLTPAPPPPAPSVVEDRVAKLGLLAPLAADDSVSEIMINGPEEVFVERAGRIELTDVRFPSAAAVRELIEGLAREVGRTIDERRPMLDARMQDGSRLNAILPPLSLRGPCVTIRRFPSRRLSAEDLVAGGTLSESMLGFLHLAVQGKLSLLVSGGTGSGKTTVLNALCAFVGADQRIITIEDAAELRLPQRHVIPLETRPPDPDGTGEVSVRDLVRNALRMRPDRIVVGEVRGAEALDMLQAMNTGHEGSLSTLHANSPREALQRLETLVLFAGTELPQRAVREQILGAIRLIVHVARTSEGKRRITSIAELSGMEGDQFTLGEIFRYEEAENGKNGGFLPTGYIPRCRDKLAERGFQADNAWFRPS